VTAFGITGRVTSHAAKRMTVAVIGPDDFSPPTASAGRESATVYDVPVAGSELRKARVRAARHGMECGVTVR
jgi:hypothetical protein